MKFKISSTNSKKIRENWANVIVHMPHTLIINLGKFGIFFDNKQLGNFNNIHFKIFMVRCCQIYTESIPKRLYHQNVCH